MQSFMKYFGAASMLTFLVLLSSLIFGGVATATVVLILGILEVSNSVDNAVANAVKLKTLSPAAQHWFMFFGILIAVFGMRLIIPALIVCITGGLTFMGTFALAVHDPKQYGIILEQAHPILAAFGGSFLFMIFANFFIDPDKDSHWLPPIEIPLSKLAFWEGIKITIALAIVVGFDWALYHSYSSSEAIHFLIAGLVGIFSNVAVEFLGNWVEKFGDDGDNQKAVPAGGLSLKMAIPALMYLEVLDASMSFDGVMGAFALSSDIFIIMAGLGIGAFWVRSLTLMAVEKGTLAEFRYLENGAFWAIGILSIVLFVSTKVELPDWFVALFSAGVIAASVISSIRSNRTEALASA
jgi:hypothetical protein